MIIFAIILFTLLIIGLCVFMGLIYESLSEDHTEMRKEISRINDKLTKWENHETY